MTLLCTGYIAVCSEETALVVSWSTAHHAKIRDYLGAYNCIGKSLALVILRTTVVRVLLEFDVDFADPNRKGVACMEGARTQFNTLPGPLHLKFHALQEKQSQE